MGEKVLVAMSGGVDSSVAALLLQKQGYEVGGATFLLFDGCNEDNAGDARKVCDQLGIPHHLLDYRALFRERVLDYFANSYLAGETPNPCVTCNRAIKFGRFLTDADTLGYRFISTGHYAGVRQDADGRFSLWRSAQEKKDQSYVLYHLSQAQLSRLLLPIERYPKEQVRAIAAEAGLPVASKSDSQDICFVPDGDYIPFIERHLGRPSVPGDYLDEAGEVIGRHQGFWHYTIGQRKGLGVSFGRHRFVSRIDPLENTVTLSDEAAVFSDTLLADDLRMLTPAEGSFQAQVKIRYAHRPAPATVHPLPAGGVQVRFEQPQRAITRGQAVVFYEGDRVLGGATIR